MIRNNALVNFTVGFVKVTGAIPTGIFLKPRVFLEEEAKRSIPKPGILVSNHQHLLDFVLYLLIFPFQTIRFPMAEVLFNKGKLFSHFLYCMGGIRVDRDAKTFDFISDCIEVLDKGGRLGIFPQGRLPVNGNPFPFTVSTAVIATHAEAPIVPVYTDGSYGITKRAKVMIGKPFYLSEHAQPGLSEEAQLQHLTAVLEEKVYDLGRQLEARLANEKSKAV